jgi:PAS domain S-box-containing protein
MLLTSVVLIQTALIVELLWLRARQRKRERDLVVTNDRLRLALEGGGSLGWEWDVKSGVLQWFGDLQTVFGIPSETYSGRLEDFFRRVHRDDRALVSREVTDARQNRNLYTAEFRVVREDGTVRWVTAGGKFYYGGNGEAARMLGVATDITEIKQMEAALRESEQKFSKAFRHSPVCITITSAKDNRYIDVSETFEEVTGWSREETVGRTPFDLGLWVHPEDRLSLLRRLAAGEPVRNFEYRFRTRSGETGIALGFAELIEISGEQCVISVSSDVTDQKRAEAILRDSEERFRVVANTVPVMIWMSGIDKLCIYVNTTWLEFTGRSYQEEIGNGWAAGIHPEDWEASLDNYNIKFDRREPFRIEYRFRRYDGEYRWIVDSGVPRFDEDGSFLGYTGSALDITDRKFAEEALSKMSQRLIEAQENERRWIARELHDDINQRLSLLIGNLDRLRQRVSPLGAEITTKMGEANAQALELSQDIQALSHRLHSSRLEHLGLAKAAAGFCKELSTQHSVEVDFRAHDVPNDLPREHALCLFRVLQEALQNAVKHSGANQFEALLNGRPDIIQLTVRDGGVGFDQNATVMGNGLGLTSMRERLKLVNGQLSINSQLQRGTTIHASVPVSNRKTAARASG